MKTHSIQSVIKRRHRMLQKHVSPFNISIKRNFCTQMKMKHSALIINGRKLASNVLNAIPNQVLHFKQSYNRTPGLAVILVKYRSDSLVYTQLKSKKAKQLGIKSFDYYLNETETTKQSLIKLIEKLNTNNEIDGILLQLPLPPSLSDYTNDIIDHISPFKDIDGLTSKNQGILTKYSRTLIANNLHNINYNAINSNNYMKYLNFPCTPLAVLHILEHLETINKNKYKIECKNIVMIGRSSLVGTPLSIMLSAKNATVTLCHSFTDKITNNLNKHCQNADIIIVAAGYPNLITKQSIKHGCIVIDVGTNVIEYKNGNTKKLIGDVSYDEVKDMTCAITPVPGGVGPLTVAMLFTNTIRAAKCRELHNLTLLKNKKLQKL
eukprot:134446_1